MSSDPTPAPDTPEPASENKEGKTPEVRRPRKFVPVRQEEDAASLSGDQLRALGEQLQALFSLAGAKPPAADSAQSEAGVKAKNRRFTAKGAAPAEAPAAPPAVLPGETAASPTAKPKTPTPPDKPVEEAFAELRRIKQLRDKQRRRRNLILGGLALAAVAFLAGRWSAPAAPGSTATKEPNTATTGPRAAGLPPWPQPAIDRLGQILALDHEGKIEDAYKSANELRATAGSLPGLELYLGNLTTRRLRYNDAHAQLGAFSGVDIPPLLNAVGCDQIGFVYARQRNFLRAIKFFSDAVANDPFQAKYYLHWGEALRRRGKQGEAVGILEPGLLRVPNTAESDGMRGAVSLKLSLAKLEANQAGPSKEQIAAGLQDPGQAPYWQLISAAQALQDSHFPEAIDALQKAKAGLSADTYDTLASDYFFRAFSSQNEVAAALPSNDIPHQAARVKRGDYFVDP